MGVAVTAVLVITGALSHPKRGSDDHSAAAAALVAAYRRSREGAYAVDAEFTRTMTDGRQLVSGMLIAQRPPDQIRRQFGGLVGAVGGRDVNCSTAPGGQFSCAPGAPATPYEADVERDVANLSSYFDPESPPLYEATRTAAGCFEITLVRSAIDPTYGRFARMCFDDATGAMTEFELRRQDGSVDVVHAITVRQVTDLDFDLSRNEAYDQRNDDLQGARGIPPTTAPTPTTASSTTAPESAPTTGR